MLCSSCEKAEASVYFKQLVNNQVSEAHVCLKCARALESAELSTGSPIFDLLSALGGADAARRRTPRCAACGTAYSEFKKTGFLGCPECYREFAEPLKEVLKRIHGAVRHRGKIPACAGAELKSQRAGRLQKELDRAVREERYENAAEIRNRMKELGA
ncbi:MAG: UvrB/UvrC motif-containing protein [Elusimicrobiota bacterium]